MGNTKEEAGQIGEKFFTNNFQKFRGSFPVQGKLFLQNTVRDALGMYASHHVVFFSQVRPFSSKAPTEITKRLEKRILATSQAISDGLY